MAEEILSTKLYPPTLPRGWIARAGPARRLDEGRRGAITLVSAPPGYGKSSCVAAWLETRYEPHAWLSLEAGDSDPGKFVAYLVAAVRTMFQEVCSETEALLHAAELPPVSALACSLANELNAIETPFILVLDDYQEIHHPAIHDLLSELVAHPPQCLHVIVITRRDPPLPLESLRGRGQLVEVRLQDLQFDRSESDRFVGQNKRLSLNARSLAHLHDIIEGWPVGLRLVSLALRTQDAPEAFLRDLKGSIHEVQGYLAQEVLAGLPAVLQQRLLEICVLDRFCAPLCDAVCTPERNALAKDVDGRAFVEELQARGLFVIALGERREWYRFHHTFVGFLRDRLEHECGPDEIAALHSRAARWYDEEDLPEEALHHALAAGDLERAGDVVRHRYSELIDRQEWVRLRGWLALLPKSIADEDPTLLVARAWCCEHRSRSCAEEHLQKAEVRLFESPPAESACQAIQGEIEALRAIHEYNAGRGEKALACADRALVELAPNAHGPRAYAFVIGALARQSVGDLRGCLDSLLAALEDHSADATLRSILLTGVSHAHWLEGDLVRMRRSALQNLQVGEEGELPTSIAYGRYLLGVLHYMRDERAKAERNLQAVIDLRFLGSQIEYCHAAFALALVLLSEKRTQEAREVVESVSHRALEIGNARLVELVRAFEAELDLRLGCEAEALHWAQSRSPEPFRDIYMFYLPQLTLAKVWLAEAGCENRQSAAALLDGLLDLPHAAHNVPVRIQALSLRALAHAGEGDEEAALGALAEALLLAAPGGFVRPFADLGAPMAALLQRLPQAVTGTEHAGRVLAAFGPEAPAGEARPASTAVLSDGAGALVEPLTIREQDVLELLIERLRDKEIAEELVISPTTVKSHLKSLYRKLGVGNRREAVARARELGILAGR